MFIKGIVNLRQTGIFILISQTKIVSMKMRNSEEKREDSEAVQGGIVKSLIQNFAAEGETGSDENFTSGRRY